MSGGVTRELSLADAVKELETIRQKRGELDASQDGDAPSADDVGAGAGDTAFAKADLDVLFGVTE